MSNYLAVIDRFIAKLSQLVRLEVQQGWHDVTLLNVVNLGGNLARVNLDECSIVEANEKGYLIFPQGKVRWLAQQIVVPHSLKDYPVTGMSLRLVLTWWAEDAQIFINGELVQQGDLFDSSARVLITDNAQAGDEFLVTMCLASPQHDIGALMRSHLIYELEPPQIDPGFVADEIKVLCKYIAQFEPERLEILTAELKRFAWQQIGDREAFTQELLKLRSRLLSLAAIKQRRFNLLGHAHLDMAWLWTTDETYEVAERTFNSVLNLQQDFPQLKFGHTSPALYEWIEHNRPELFASIEKAVAANTWELLGGMWIEPETNLISGESLIRQFLYGQQYYRDKFGKICRVAWLPDSFGFTWQLPQIAQQCGIEYFVTGKLHWNDTTKFPHGCFWWESPDGTQLLTLMSPPNVTGVMDTNPITMSDYAVEWETQTGLQEIFWLPGVGDHGGGPTRDMLEVAQKWNSSPFFPQVQFSTAVDYLDRIAKSDRQDGDYLTQRRRDAEAGQQDRGSQFPIWQNELYLELHRGCYTVRAEQKRFNRRCERLLYAAELWSTLAEVICQDYFISLIVAGISSMAIPEVTDLENVNAQQIIDLAWKKVLFNQFHDILPGTSIPEVFTEANRDWEKAIALGKCCLQTALKAISTQIELPEPPDANAKAIVAFNSLNWQRSELVSIATEEKYHRVWDDNGLQVESQVESGQLLFIANVSGVGYRVYWLLPSELSQDSVLQRDYILENEYLKVECDRTTGDLISIYDKQNSWEVLADYGNRLQFFSDRGQYWDAWNIDPEYEQKQLPTAVLKSIEWIESNSLRQKLRVVMQFDKSEFARDYILEAHSPILKIANRVDWQETHVMVKAAFSLNLDSDFLTSEIPCSAIARTTKPQTSEERAKWEVSALNWSDWSDKSGEYGVSLLNDCKYGYDASPNQIRLTLLRSPVWPDPQSDRGIHHFTYAIYPHLQGWQEANTVRRGYELNTPLHILPIETDRQSKRSYLRPTGELLNLTADNLILMALKYSADEKLILRCYEAHGEAAELKLQGDLNLAIASSCNSLEEDIQAGSSQIKPYKISTFKLG